MSDFALLKLIMCIFVGPYDELNPLTATLNLSEIVSMSFSLTSFFDLFPEIKTSILIILF